MSESSEPPDQLKEVFSAAAEIAKLVPESMQEAAFNRALDELLKPSRSGKRTPQRKPKKPSARGSVTATVRRSTGRPGPKAAVESLIDGGYFKEPRAPAEVRAELQHKKGLRFKPTDISPAFTRLLREGKLAREKSEGGEYEYHAP